MQEKKFKNIVLFIGLTIVITIAVQFYWNLKIYEINKQQLNNQIKVSFDKSIENYFNELAKSNVPTFINSDSIMHTEQSKWSNKDTVIFREHGYWKDSAGNNIDQTKKYAIRDTTHDSKTFKIRSKNSGETFPFHSVDPKNIKHISIHKTGIDSLKFEILTKKIMLSFRENIVNLKKIDSLFKEDLNQKEIKIQNGFKYEERDLITRKTIIRKFNLDEFSSEYNSINSSPWFLPPNSKLQLRYTDSTFEILKRMSASLLLSFILSLFIVGSLLFLLKIIFKQKQLSAIKNDFISNITHEFKTPISTIAVALEGFEKFDVLKDEDKRNQYLSISNEQLEKLNGMVEKLLETSTLNADQYELEFNPINLSKLIKKLADKHQFSDSNKSISIDIDDHIVIPLDIFHFENALNNVIDNAIKYGGDQIKISTTSKKDSLEIYVEDNGIGIDEKYKSKIFDQFYRIPTGNVHDVKGFGIGLYYTKSIIEKHEGHISMSENKKGKVVFKIVLPNE